MNKYIKIFELYFTLVNYLKYIYTDTITNKVYLFFKSSVVNDVSFSYQNI